MDLGLLLQIIILKLKQSQDENTEYILTDKLTQTQIRNKNELPEIDTKCDLNN